MQRADQRGVRFANRDREPSKTELFSPASHDVFADRGTLARERLARSSDTLSPLVRPSGKRVHLCLTQIHVGDIDESVRAQHPRDGFIDQDRRVVVSPFPRQDDGVYPAAARAPARADRFPGATEPEVGTVGAEHSLFVVHNSPIKTPGLRDQTSRR
jgi:hypothetical protein